MDSTRSFYDRISRVYGLVTTFHGNGPTSLNPHSAVRIDGQLDDVVIDEPVLKRCEVSLQVRSRQGNFGQ